MGGRLESSPSGLMRSTRGERLAICEGRSPRRVSVVASPGCLCSSTSSSAALQSSDYCKCWMPCRPRMPWMHLQGDGLYLYRS